MQDFAVVVCVKPKCTVQDQQALGLSCWFSDHKLQLFNLKPSFGFCSDMDVFSDIVLKCLEVPDCLVHIHDGFFFGWVCVCSAGPETQFVSLRCLLPLRAASRLSELTLTL